MADSVSRFVPVRHRYIMTRRNTPRLRVLALPCAGFFVVSMLGTAMTGGMAHLSGGVQIASAGPVILGPGMEEDTDRSILDRLALTQKRLQRSLAGGNEDADNAMAETLAAAEPAAGIASAAVAEDAQLAEARVTGPQERTVKIGTGDTLTGVLNRAGLSRNEAYQVAQAMKEHVNPRTLKPGQVLNITMNPHDGGDDSSSGYRFASMNMALDSLRVVSVHRNDEADGGYQTDLQEKEVFTRVYAQMAEVENSLFGSAAKAGIPSAVVADAIRVYSWDIDFQRDVRRGDKLEVMYEQMETEDGQRVKTGNVLFARLTLDGVEIPVYRFEMKGGRVDYFQRNGKSIRKTLMKTPVDGARVSSNFGMRRHPIQGYNKMHKGMDFAAPTGTPIYAAGDGVVQRANRFSGYGNYVRIRHNSQVSTAYAHLHRFAKGVTAGTRVRQGDIIGYVGSTGNSTGPHLHYEVLLNGVQVDPRSVNLPTGEILEGEQLRQFQARVREIDRQYNSSRSLKYAQNSKASSRQTSLR